MAFAHLRPSLDFGQVGERLRYCPTTPKVFLGLPGKLLLGAMGLLSIAAIVSGVVLYGPFMRKLPYGTVRRERPRRIRWLDWHNLIGVTSLSWAFVVGATGAIDTLDDLLLNS